MSDSDQPQPTRQQRLKVLLWEQNLAELSPLRRAGVRQLQTVVLVGRDFIVNQCLLRAAALTYYSMLSIVPLLALTFALLKAFGVQNMLQPLIMEKLNVGDGEAVTLLMSYINNTQVGKMGAFGLLFLLIAVISLLTNVEKTFNYIWGVKGVRPLLRRFADYLSVVLVGPVLIISAISMTSSLASHVLVQKLIELQLIGSLVLLLFKVAPFVFMWLAFTVLYVFMSNIKVEWRAAFIGGVFGGTLWQLAQWAYVNFQVGVAKYNAIYGTMAALPIFMVWLYLSWVIVLFGLEVTYAKQNLRSSGRDLRAADVSRTSFEQVALAILVTLAERFSTGKPPLRQEQLAKQLFIPPRLCRSILRLLAEIGFVVETSSSHGHFSYQLGRAADNLTLAELLKTMRDKGEGVRYLRPHRQTIVALDALQKMEELLTAGLQGRTLKDLVQQCTGQSAAEPLPAPESVENGTPPE